MNTITTRSTLLYTHPRGGEQGTLTKSSGITATKGLRELLNAQVLVHLMILRPVLRVLFRARVKDAYRLATLERFVLVANHNSHLDTPLLYLTLPVSQIAKTRPVAAVEYFSRHPILFALASFLFRPIWIGRDMPGELAIESIIEALDDGDSVILFPEGSRGLPGEIARFKIGVGRLLQRRPGVQVVPVFLKGTERSLPRGTTIPRLVSHRVVVGSPSEVEGAPSEVAQTLRNDVKALGRPLALEKGREAATRHQPLCIAVIGIDGCGKSTLSRQLALELSGTSRTCLVSDKLEFYERGHRTTPLLPWMEMVRQWTGARAKLARSLADYKIPKLIELLLRDFVAGKVERKGIVDVIVTDGSPLINLIAWAVLYYERSFDEKACVQAMAVLTSGARCTGDSLRERFPELAVLTRLRLNHLRAPDATVLLDIDPGLAIQRIGSRHGHRQVHENASSLGKLRSAYLTVHRILESHPGIVAHRLDAELELDALLDETLQLTT